MSPKVQAEKVVGYLAGRYGELLNGAIVYTQRRAYLVQDAHMESGGRHGKFKLMEAPAHLSYKTRGFGTNDNCLVQIVWEEGPYEWALNNTFRVTETLRALGLESHAECYNGFVLDVYPS